MWLSWTGLDMCGAKRTRHSIFFFLHRAGIVKPLTMRVIVSSKALFTKDTPKFCTQPLCFDTARIWPCWFLFLTCCDSWAPKLLGQFKEAVLIPGHFNGIKCKNARALTYRCKTKNLRRLKLIHYTMRLIIVWSFLYVKTPEFNF